MTLGDPEGLVPGFDPATEFALADLDLLMLSVSDNDATNAIIDRVGMDAVNAVGARLELRHTALRRRMMDFTAARSGRDNTTCAGDLAALMSAPAPHGGSVPSVAGARLHLSIDEWTDPVELGISDASGSYHLDVPEKKLRRTVSPEFCVRRLCNAALIANAAGFGPGWAELPAAKGGRMGEMKPEYAQDFHLVADFPIAGRVVDAGGKPIAGAAVAVYRMFDLADPRWKHDAPRDQGRQPGSHEPRAERSGQLVHSAVSDGLENDPARHD